MNLESGSSDDDDDDDFKPEKPETSEEEEEEEEEFDEAEEEITAKLGMVYLCLYQTKEMLEKIILLCFTITVRKISSLL